MSTPPLHERVKSNSTAYVEGFQEQLKSRLKKGMQLYFQQNQETEVYVGKLRWQDRGWR